MAKLLDGTRIYGNANVDSNLLVNGTTVSTSTTTGTLRVAGGVGVIGNIWASTTVFANAFTSQNAGQITGYHTGAIGANTANTGAFTTLTATGAVTGNTFTGIAVYGGTIGNTGATHTGSTFNATGAVTGNTFTGIAVYGGTIGNTGATLSGGNLNIGAGVVNNYKISVTGGSLSTTANSQILGQTLLCNSSNADYLEISNTRNQSGGADWTTSGWRLQEKIDATWMGYIQFNNGSGTATNNGGISFGTGTSTVGPNAISERIRIDSSGHLLPAANVAYNLGSTTANWSTVYAVTFSGTSTTAKYADLAEKYIADCELSPGDVVVFGGTNEITTTTVSHDDRIAGVVSTNPAYLMNSDANGYPIGLQGRLPCRVLGPVTKGQSLVASNIAGVAQALDKTLYTPGCVIGKSLEEITTDEIKTIEIVVGRL
jgi:hypothetical protein